MSECAANKNSPEEPSGSPGLLRYYDFVGTTETSHIGLLAAHLRFDHRLQVTVEVAKGLLDERDGLLRQGFLRCGQCAVVGNALRVLVELVLFLQGINVGLVDILDSIEHRVGGILETGLRKLVVDVAVCNADTLVQAPAKDNCHCGDAGSKSDFQKFIHKSLSFLLGFRALL